MGEETLAKSYNCLPLDPTANPQLLLMIQEIPNYDIDGLSHDLNSPSGKQLMMI
jgi:hypothetical protein